MAGQLSGTRREDDDPRSLRNRKARLASLKARHRDLTAATAPDPAEPRPEAAAAKLVQMVSGGMGPAGQFRRQMIGRLFRMLTEQPKDESGVVSGTPFTRAGIERLMTLLAQRAEDRTAPGSKVAQSALRFIAAQNGDSDAVGGASLDKLRLLARQAEAYKLRDGDTGT